MKMLGNMDTELKSEVIEMDNAYGNVFTVTQEELEVGSYVTLQVADGTEPIVEDVVIECVDLKPDAGGDAGQEIVLNTGDTGNVILAENIPISDAANTDPLNLQNDSVVKFGVDIANESEESSTGYLDIKPEVYGSASSAWQYDNEDIKSESSTDEASYLHLSGDGALTISKLRSGQAMGQIKTFTQTTDPTTIEESQRTEKPYKCDVCGRGFSIYTTLQEHLTSHVIDEEKPHSCDFCQKSFSQLSSLKRHLKTHAEGPLHIDEKGSKAAKIPKPQPPQQIYGSKKQHNCMFCGRAFPHQSYLKRHVVTHTGEKPHKCDICGSTFTRAWTLKEHLRLHTEGKIRNCGECGKKFKDAGELRQHVLTHQGKKPHKCEICNKAFRYSSKLEQHMRTHELEDE